MTFSEELDEAIQSALDKLNSRDVHGVSWGAGYNSGRLEALIDVREMLKQYFNEVVLVSGGK